MAEQHDTDRWGDIRGIHREYANFYRMLRGGVIICLFVFIGWSVFQESDEPRAFGMNLWTEIAGIAVTVLIIDLLNEMRAERRYKQQLVDEAASTSNETAKHAVHVMRRRGWLQGEHGLLKSAYLVHADLREAYLNGANLEGARLNFVNFEHANLVVSRLNEADLTSAGLRSATMVHAKLRGTVLVNAYLRGANCSATNFENANLLGASLEGATLHEANFKSAVLIAAKLCDADLRDANLEGAELTDADFSGATLPDGRLYSDAIDMRQFTDRNHPGFWRSFNSLSPAYRGGDETWKRRGLSK